MQKAVAMAVDQDVRSVRSRGDVPSKTLAISFFNIFVLQVLDWYLQAVVSASGVTAPVYMDVRSVRSR